MVSKGSVTGNRERGRMSCVRLDFCEESKLMQVRGVQSKLKSVWVSEEMTHAHCAVVVFAWPLLNV